MNFQKVSTLDDLWEGDMAEVEVDGHIIVLVRPEGDAPRAFRASVHTRTLRSQRESSTAAY